jgi:UDP-N-acetylmuramoyl-L-alanyl-D-glutamate--2,6-diaminopimelate ligase
MTLEELCRVLPDARVPNAARALRVAAVQANSADVRPGDVFFAVRGETADGREHAAEAVARGAIAVVADAPLEAPVPVVLVDDARRALAAAAAESLGQPARRLKLVGITGTVGKTSVLTMVGEILAASGIRAGTVGSLGIHYSGYSDYTPNTTPGPLELQRALAAMVGQGTTVAAMEVTSHALVQGRVHGISYDLGIFTNLAPFEHMEYHGSFRSYAEAKRRFLEHLAPDAPLVFPGGDRAVRELTRGHPGPRISCGGSSSAVVTVRREGISLAGSSMTLRTRQPLPRIGAPPLAGLVLPIRLRALGRTSISNATLAAVAALCLGAEPAAVATALGRMEPVRRRLQVIRDAAPIIIDDTVGHPDSITGVFEVVERLPGDRLHVAFCIRGRRGPEINARDAEALVIWARRSPPRRLFVTSAAEAADERNTVTAAERTAFLRVLDEAGLDYVYEERLEDAVSGVVDGTGDGDIVLLLGAQGMDAGADIALRTLDAQHGSHGRG